MYHCKKRVNSSLLINLTQRTQWFYTQWNTHSNIGEKSKYDVLADDVSF